MKHTSIFSAYFWDCNWITFLLSLSFIHSLPQTPAFLQIYGLSLPCYWCIYTCTYMCVYKYNLLRPHSVSPKLTMWHWTTNWCGLLWGGQLLHSQTDSVGRTLCIELKPHGLFSLYFGMSTGIILALLTCDLSHCWDFMRTASALSRDTISWQSLWSLTLTIFPSHSSQCCFNLRCGCVLQMYSLGLSSKTLHFDLLWFSVVISVYCKEKFLWWAIKNTHICEYKDNWL